MIPASLAQLRKTRRKTTLVSQHVDVVSRLLTDNLVVGGLFLPF
jgi:hypothetical protein